MNLYPNRLGKQFSYSDGNDDQDRNLELASKKPKLEALKCALQDAESDASDYFSRNQNAWNHWHCRWDGQTVDGRKWHSVGAQQEIWPWIGASDTRTHTVSKIISQHETVATFALRNMKIQAQSARPFAAIKESQKATQLLNWMIGTHMQAEAAREMRFAINGRNAFGSHVIGVDWEQERRIDYINVSLMTLETLTQSQGLAGHGMMQELQGTDLSQWQAIIADESHEEALIPFIQQFSPIVTKPQARKIIRDLRELRYAEVPVPYIYLSKPRWRAMRPMVDIFFPADSCELNIHPRWTAEPERLTETELTDRIETANYDPGFVSEALDHKGDTDGPWTNRLIESSKRPEEEEKKATIWHFKYKALDRGVPVLFDTVFHMNVDTEATHGPCAYQHGEYGYHALRFENHDRPILSSRGIAEIAYTWQQEIKKQRDGRTDRVDLTLRPVMLTNYQDLLKYKSSFMPGTIIPERRDSSTRFMAPPQYDPGSTEIEMRVMADINEYFSIAGETVDPGLKQQKIQQFADDLLIELKPVINQSWKLMQQYLPDAEVAAVVGPLARPFHVSRDEIQGQYGISATIDMRNLDPDFLKMKLDAAVQVTSLDTTGIIDRTKLVTMIMETIDQDLASQVIQEQEPVTEKEVADERRDISIIIGSGIDQPLPKGANFQLRLQTFDNMMQELQQNPAATKTVQDNPEKLKVLQTRRQYYERQLQQQQNAQIGRAQVSQTFTKDAPTMALSGGGQ